MKVNIVKANNMVLVFTKPTNLKRSMKGILFKDIKKAKESIIWLINSGMKVFF